MSKKTIKSQQVLSGTQSTLTAPIQSILEGSGSNPAPIKSVMNHAGMNVGSCRKPLVDLSKDKAATLFYELQMMKNGLSAQQIPYDEVLTGIYDIAEA